MLMGANLANENLVEPNVLNPASVHSQGPTIPAASVLVVEDNDTTRRRMSNLLRASGYDVTEAVDGLDALRSVSARPFDAILLDLVLPNVDGWQFRATQLRHPEMASIPTVIVTVQPLRAPARYSLRTTDVVQKPFEDAHLLQAIERACRIRQPIRVARDPDAIGLFWSRRGEVACMDHAPDATSGRWHDERWAAIPAGLGSDRIVYRCQHCPGDASPIDRSRRSRGRKDSGRRS